MISVTCSLSPAAAALQTVRQCGQFQPMRSQGFREADQSETRTDLSWLMREQDRWLWQAISSCLPLRQFTSHWVYISLAWSSDCPVSTNCKMWMWIGIQSYNIIRQFESSYFDEVTVTRGDLRDKHVRLISCDIFGWVPRHPDAQ